MNIRLESRLWGRRMGLLAGGALFVVGLLLVQHLRHGWPFSLHHGIGVAPSARPAAAVGASQEHARTAVDVDPTKLETLGIRTEAVTAGTIANPSRAVATVVPDEARVSHVHTRVSGWIEKLYVNTTGQSVAAGDPLAAIFSQELFASQEEFLSARRATAEGPASAVVESARTRLKILGMTEGQVSALERRGTANRLVTVVTPRSGVVLHRGIAVGTAVDPSTELLTVVDLSTVWVIAEVPETNIPDIAVGTKALLEFPASGRRPFEGEVDFVYPTLSERTRSLRVRLSVANPDGALKPGLYGTAEFRVEPRRTLTVSRDAVVDTGVQQLVFVATGTGRFEPRPVRLGTRLAERVEVREGLREGEQVVSSGVFLIDSESRLRASGGGTGHSHGGHGGEKVPSTTDPATPAADSHKNHVEPSPEHQGHDLPASPGKQVPPPSESHEVNEGHPGHGG